MFSYRHAFHAGNHADVLKHLVLQLLCDYMTQKDAAIMFVDTHAGGGVYALDSSQASKNAEYETGITRLWKEKNLPTELARYVDVIKSFNPREKSGDKPRHYPGSPFIAAQLLRPADRLRLFELHPTEGRVLAQNVQELESQLPSGGRGKRIMVNQADGFVGLKALLPPPSRRALVLIDPPYEDKNDYRKVKDALEEAMKRFPTGTYAVWYPVLNRMESRQLPDKLKRLPGKDWLHVSLTVATPAPDGFGLVASGMFVVNPPYTLEDELATLMPQLVQLLGTDEGAGFTLESGVAAPIKRRPKEE